MRTEACPVRNQNEQNLFKKQELECVLNLSIVDLRLDVSSMGRKKEPTIFQKKNRPCFKKKSRVYLFLAGAPPKFVRKLFILNSTFKRQKINAVEGVLVG